MGLPFVSTLERDADYASTGNISGKLPQQAETGIGFYINANQNKELGLSKGEWTRNNLYVLANKAYYRAPAPAPAPTRGVEFVPVIFGDDAEDNEFSTGVSGIKEDGNEEAGRSYDNRVYDLQGRCVATEEQVKDVGIDIARLATRNADRMRDATAAHVDAFAARLAAGSPAADVVAAAHGVSLLAHFSSDGSFRSAAQRRGDVVGPLDAAAFLPYRDCIADWVKRHVVEEKGRASPT